MEYAKKSYHCDIHQTIFSGFYISTINGSRIIRKPISQISTKGNYILLIYFLQLNMREKYGINLLILVSRIKVVAIFV